MVEAADDLLAFIDASPSPFHAAEQAAQLLVEAGFERFDGTAPDLSPEIDGVLVHDGALVAWAGAAGAGPRPLRFVGAHTDSPNLRVKPRPDVVRAGVRQLAVEPYGGALLNSWLGRDLGLAGRVALRAPGGGVALRLLHVAEPILHVPQLAIHLDREIGDRGLQLNRQQHLNPVWALDRPDVAGVAAFLADRLGVTDADVLAWDLMCVGVEPSSRVGARGELLSAPRLDNLCSTFLAARSLADAGDGAADVLPIVVLFDHEEIGSTTAHGADGAFLTGVLDRLLEAWGGTRGVRHLLAQSVFLSADMAHATHPNYPERHEPGHWIELGGGPAVKVNVNHRYATDAVGAALFRLAAEDAGVPVQQYAHRSDMACGSTIGPLVAAQLGVATVDVGPPQLAMHSARELMAAADVGHTLAAFRSWWRVEAGTAR